MPASGPGWSCRRRASAFTARAGDEAIDETAAPGDDFLAQVCIAWEATADPLDALGVRRVIIRTGHVLSRTGGLLPYVALPYRLWLGGPLGNGRQGQPWIHIADHVAAVRWLIEHEVATGAFNLVAPQRTTNASMSRALGQALGRPAFVTVPAFVLRLLLGEEATILLEGQHAVSARLQELGFSFPVSHCRGGIERSLGLRPPVVRWPTVRYLRAGAV